MKKNLTFLMLMLSVLVSFTACSSDDDGDGLGNKDAGSENKTDVAVTGAVQEIGVTYAIVAGYVNLDRIPFSYSSCEFGMQYANNEHFKNDLDKDWGSDYYAVHELVGNKFTFHIDEMEPATPKYYRTYVRVNGTYYYGETKTVTPNDFQNITTTGDATDITSTSAKIVCRADTSKLVFETYKYPNQWYENLRSVGVAYSEDPSLLTDQNLKEQRQKHMFHGGVYDNIDIRKVSFQMVKDRKYTVDLSRLEPQKKYYYCAFTELCTTFRIGEIKSFTTKN